MYINNVNRSKIVEGKINRYITRQAIIYVHFSIIREPLSTITRTVLPYPSENYLRKNEDKFIMLPVIAPHKMKNKILLL